MIEDTAWGCGLTFRQTIRTWGDVELALTLPKTITTGEGGGGLQGRYCRRTRGGMA